MSSNGLRRLGHGRLMNHCDRCSKDISEIILVESPYFAEGDNRLYCLDCFAYLFPPGCTDEIELAEPDDSNLIFPGDEL